MEDDVSSRLEEGTRRDSRGAGMKFGARFGDLFLRSRRRGDLRRFRRRVNRRRLRRGRLRRRRRACRIRGVLRERGRFKLRRRDRFIRKLLRRRTRPVGTYDGEA